MKNLHNIGPDIPDIIKLIVTRWHIASPDELNRRFGRTKWENNKLYYRRDGSPNWNIIRFRGEPDYISISGYEADFDYCYTARTEIGIECFQPDMLRG